MTYILLPLDFRIVEDCGKIDKDRDVVCEDWCILLKIEAVTLILQRSSYSRYIPDKNFTFSQIGCSFNTNNG